MKLTDVLVKVQPLETKGNMDIEITGVQMDSRKVKKGDLFIAVKGTQTDGHAFISKALELGAIAVLQSNELSAELLEGVTYVRVADTEDAVGKVATEFFGDPSRKLQLVGVTGTNGKTTIATVLYNMYRAFGHKVGLCSTVCNYIDDQAVPADHTTPDPITLNELLARMVEAGCEYAFMECSSHAIQQKRIGGLHFVGALFTNLTRDHLDYHKTFENYRNAKKMFFDGLDKDAFAITNADDRNGMVMVQNTKATIKTYSTRTVADFKGRILEESLEGMLLDIDGGLHRSFQREQPARCLWCCHYAGQRAAGGVARDVHSSSRQWPLRSHSLKGWGECNCRLCSYARCTYQCAYYYQRNRKGKSQRYHSVWSWR